MKNSTTRRCLLLFATLLISLACRAGDKDARVMVSTGLLYENGWDVTVAIEKERRYHNAVEFFANGYLQWKKCEDCGHVCKDTFWRNYRTWELGAAYKPCVGRGKNTYSNVRLGFGLGSDLDNFLGSFQLGYEKNYCLRGNWQVFWQLRTAVVVSRSLDFRTGIAVGVKIP